MNIKNIISRVTPTRFHHLLDNKGLIKILKNINWLTFEKIFQLAFGLFVYAIVAQYLGPEQFGILNYALAFSGLFLAFNTLGLDSIVVREIVHTPKQSKEILGSALVMRLIGSLLLIAISSLAIYFIKPDDTMLLLFVMIISLGYLFKSFATIDLYFQSQVKSKYTVYARSIAFIIVSGLKLLFVFTQQPLIAFVLMYALDAIISSVMLIFYYKYVTLDTIVSWRPRLKRMRSLLQDSWPLILSSIAIMIYMRIDQVMIGSMIDNEAVGIYSVAVKLSETWYFIPNMICLSVFPAILKARKQSQELYLKRIQTLFDAFTWFTIIISLGVSLLSPFIIDILYGDKFASAATVLSIHIWAGLFVFLGGASSYYLISENLIRITLYRTLAGAVINIVLNLIFIPVYGIIGVAIATIISYATAAFISNAFYKNSRIIFIMQLKSFNILSVIRRLK
jgi:PST family polysaccharide transporter